MSAAASRRAAAPAPTRREERSHRPHLRIVERVRSLKRPLLVGFLVVTVIGALFALAALNAILVAGQAELDSVNRQIELTERQQARLQVRVAELSAPAEIIARAEAMGMTRAAPPVHLPAVEDPLGPPPPGPEAPAASEPRAGEVDPVESAGDGS